MVPHLCRPYKPKSVESVFRYTCCITLPEASIECVGPISALLRPDNTPSFEVMSRTAVASRWQHSESDLARPQI